jgi:D-arabinonate dehydratase/D-galactarolactone cycloisomerase
MRIVEVESYALAATNPDRRPYWGKASWGMAGESAVNANWEPYRYPTPARMQPVYSDTIDTTVVKIVTDTGLVGWGEAKAPVAPRVCKLIVDELFRETLLGQDPFDVEVIWETLYASMRLRGHAGGFLVEALSGVDIALWDLIGKATGKPLHKLLGGAYRSRVRVYASGVPATRAHPGEPDWQRMLAAIEEIRERGFTGFKMGIGFSPEADLRSLQAAREVAGPDMAIFADAAGNYDVSTAIALGRELEALDIGFFEAPLPHEQIDGYAEVARALAIPVANDVLVSRYQVLEYLKRGGLDVVQPDVCRAGGVSELKRIAVLADAFGVGFTPHVSIGSAIHVAASLHLAAAVPNLVQMEFWYGQNPLGDAVLERPALTLEDGHVTVPQGPGLGIDVDEGKLFEHAMPLLKT